MSSTQGLQGRMGFRLWRCNGKSVLIRGNTQGGRVGMFGRKVRSCLVEDFKKPIIKYKVGKLIGVRLWRTFNTG